MRRKGNGNKGNRNGDNTGPAWLLYLAITVNSDVGVVGTFSIVTFT